MIFFFFFQAEDGIRDGHVTGVQTCALPIWVLRRPVQLSGRRRRSSGAYLAPSWRPADAARMLEHPHVVEVDVRSGPAREHGHPAAGGGVRGGVILPKRRRSRSCGCELDPLWRSAEPARIP